MLTLSLSGKCEHRGESKEYGEKCETNDIIRVKVDTIDGLLSFSKNGRDYGIGESTISCCFYECSELIVCVCVCV